MLTNAKYRVYIEANKDNDLYLPHALTFFGKNIIKVCRMYIMLSTAESRCSEITVAFSRNWYSRINVF